ncbi:DNRLRE domain-containing protein [bacterium]|nr:DNRLRE domain-containing protein [bacterium]
MRNHLCVFVLAVLCAFSAQRASAVSVPASAAAAIRSSQPLVNDSTNFSWCNFNAAAGNLGGMMLCKFDLSSYTGLVVDGDAQLQVRAYWVQSGYAWNFGTREVISNWDESTVTWANFVGPTTGTAWQATVGPLMESKVVNAAALWQFTVSNSVIQAMLDNPAANNGIALAGNGNICVRTPVFWNVADHPTLIFNTLSTNQPPNTPTNLSPADAAMALPPTGVELTASPFSDPNGHAHSNSQWQVARSITFALKDMAWDSGDSSTMLTNAPVPAASLQYGMRHYWRVRYMDNSVDTPKYSEWSAPTYFDTALNLIQPQSRIVNKSVMIAPGRTDAPAGQTFAFANSNFNGDAVMSFNPINTTTNIAPAGVCMYWFDMRVFSRYTGLSVDSDGDLAVDVGWTDVNHPPTFRLHAVLAGWEPDGVTWNTFVGADWGTWATKFGIELDAKLIDATGTTYHWTVPKSLVQAWVNDTNLNFGVALIPQSSGNSILFTQSAPLPPSLTFDLSTTNAVPPAQPSNVSPADGAINQQLTPTLESSAYSGASPQGAAQWQIASEPSFAAPLWDATSTSGFTQITVVSNVLQFSGRYYWRVRHIALDGGKSAYSVPTSFDTEVKAGTFNKLALQNAMILRSQPSSNFNGSVDTFFWPMPASNGICGIIMSWFDLSIFSGLDTESNASFMVRNGFVDPNFGPINLICYELLKPFNEASETWASYVGDTSHTNYFGESFGSQTLPLEGFGTTTWVISQALIQKWLDTPGTNFGLALIPETGNGNALIYTRRGAATSPSLTVSVVPEPAALALVALCMAAMCRKRN